MGLKFSVEPTGMNYNFYINGPIVKADEYADLVAALYSAKSTESVILHINTPGGNLDTTLGILNAMKACEGEVISIAAGQVASAGTLLLFAAPQIGIGPYAYAMLHDGSELTSGKINENLRQATFSADQIRDLYFDIYSPFFTKEEIESILDGKDMWLTNKQLKERLKNAKGMEEEVND